ncbi:MAG: glutamate 5-kinase [Peptococcaceae bacterium]|jgi:glutamate 5-kinase|nr:glutamate 5-kinase [Peptococcaceae bacterium]
MRIVIKIGSSSLNLPQGGLDDAAIARIVQATAQLKASEVDVVIVSSGAVAAGMGQLKRTDRPIHLTDRQAAAAVGQSVLMESYTHLLARKNLVGAQVLLSRLDLADPARYINAQNTLERLLLWGVVPIINENDTVAVEELNIGDNDTLSALVAGLAHADLLFILTDVDGLYTANPRHDEQARIIAQVDDVGQVWSLAGGAGSMLGTGGMVTKLKAAEIVTRFGIGMILMNANKIERLPDVVSGEVREGTCFQPQKHRLAGRKRWIAYAGLSEGTVTVDQGAANALLHEGKSLLASGIAGIDGAWERHELVRVTDPSGQGIARGLVALSSQEILRVKGMHSEELLREIPDLRSPEIIHRDYMTVMPEGLNSRESGGKMSSP